MGPLVGAAFSTWWAGSIADRVTLLLARRNKGVREPEQRLWMLVPTAVVSCVGLIIWGVGVEHGIHWMGLVVGITLFTFSVVTGSSVSLSYNVDCFKDISGTSTISVIIVRNTLSFAFSYGITPWYNKIGLQNCFIMVGFMSFGVTLTALIMIWKGKGLRIIAAPRYWKFVETCFGH
jgi:hypothetical protein